MEPIFSIIIPAYNAEKTLAKAVSSAIRQSLDDCFYEIVVIDDGSTDGTPLLLEQLSSQAGNIAIHANEKNRGQGFSRNRGIALAAGRYVTFLDADDFLTPDALELFLESVREHRPDIIIANLARISPFGDPLPTLASSRHIPANLRRETLAGKRSFCAVGAAYEKSFLERRGIRFAEGVFFEDIPFVIHSVLRAVTICALDEVVYYWVAWGQTITSTISRKKIQDAITAWEHAYAILDSEGLLAKYASGWEQGLMTFMKVIDKRLLRYSDEVGELQAFFRKAVEASLLFQRRKLTGKILAALSPSYPGTFLPFSGVNALPEMAEATAGAVLLIAQIDGHFRHLAPIARRLHAFGIKAVLFDVSRSTGLAPGRNVTREELHEFSDIICFSIDQKKIRPLFFNVRAAVVCLDWGKEGRELVRQLQQRAIPVLAFYEGINDDYGLHPPAPPRKKSLPYRNADFLLLPGEYYANPYCKQKTFVVGLPSLHGLLREKAVFPTTPVAVINVNFTYGILEGCRREFLDTATIACKELGIPCIISQHPADKGDLSPFSPSARSIYEDIRQGTLLISRFSTCVLEALALGKPVIYHNPHCEKYPKFQDDPMGAFPVTRSTEELVQAIGNVLADVAAGVDFRVRAREYLQQHANLFAQEQPEFYAAKAICQVITDDSENFARRIAHFAAQVPFLQSSSLSYADYGKRKKLLMASYGRSQIFKKGLILLLLDRNALKNDIIKRCKNLYQKIKCNFKRLILNRLKPVSSDNS